MSQFSLNQKEDIYKEALSSIILRSKVMPGHVYGICVAIECIVDQKRYDSLFVSCEREINMEEDFEEFYSFKPDSDKAYWFKTNEERIDVLKKCIEIVKDKIKKS